MIKTIVFYLILGFLALMLIYEAITQNEPDNYRALIIIIVMGVFYYKALKHEKQDFDTKQEQGDS